VCEAVPPGATPAAVVGHDDLARLDQVDLVPRGDLCLIARASRGARPRVGVRELAVLLGCSLQRTETCKVRRRSAAGCTRRVWWAGCGRCGGRRVGMRGVRCDGCFLSASAAEPVPHDHDQRSECGLTVGHLLVEPDVERVHRLEQRRVSRSRCPRRRRRGSCWPRRPCCRSCGRVARCSRRPTKRELTAA